MAPSWLGNSHWGPVCLVLRRTGNHLAGIPLCDTVTPVGDTVIPVCYTVTPVCNTGTPYVTLLPICDTVTPVCDTVTPVCDTVTPVWWPPPFWGPPDQDSCLVRYFLPLVFVISDRSQLPSSLTGFYLLDV